jgi:hypothetical protein
MIGFFLKWIIRLVIIGVLFYVLLYYAMTAHLPSVDTFNEDFNTEIKNCKIKKITKKKSEKGIINIYCVKNGKINKFKINAKEIFFKVSNKPYAYLDMNSILKETEPKQILDKITKSYGNTMIYKIYYKNNQ